MLSSAASRKPGFRDIPPLERGSDIIRQAIRELRTRLPDSWGIELELEAQAGDGHRLDALANVSTPDGRPLLLAIEAKRSITPRDAGPVLEQLRRLINMMPSEAYVLPVLVARYLPVSARERIADLGAGFLDATGNIRLAIDRPALFIADRGANSDPWRGPGRPRSGLRGEPAARVVRALVDFAPPYSVPELSARSGASTGATYRVVEFLEEEELITRQAYGAISDVRWRELLMRWSEDYGVAASNTVSLFIEPRGLSVLMDRLRDAPNLKYAVTGSFAAERLAPFAPPRQAMIYADDPDQLASALELRPTTTGANVVLAAPAYDVVFERADAIDAIKMAAPSQVAVDLLTGPGRNPSEAVALLDWMERNESAWRR